MNSMDTDFNKIEWAEMLNETEKYSKEFDRWRSITRTTSRLDMYKEIDTYPISNVSKMHIAANKILGITVESMTKKASIRFGVKDDTRTENSEK
jgi:hypothetical protein